MLIEGQVVLDDFRSWRTFLYDDETRSAELLRFRTHKGIKAFSSLTVGQVTIGGHDAILVTMFLMGYGTPSPEDGTLVYYRTLPDGTE